MPTVNASNLLLLCCLLSCFVKLQAQELLFSRPQKLSGKINEYEILGNTDAGLLVHKWGDRYHAIEAYDTQNMALKWTKEIFLPDKKAKVIAIVPYKNELLLFYTVKQKRITYVYARKVSAELHTLMPEIVADTVQKNFGSYGYSYQVAVSKNKSFICLQRFTNDFNGISSAQCILLNRNLEILGKTNIPITNRLLNKENFLSNDGEVFLLDTQIKRTVGSNNPLYENFKLLRYNFAQGKLSSIVLENGLYLLNDIQFEIDDRNKRIVTAGYYTEKQSGDISGYFYLFIDLVTETVSEQVFQPFSPEIIQRIVRTSVVRSRDQISNLNARQLITRQDGGALLIGELYYSVQQNMPRATFDSFYARQLGTSFYYNDVLLLSINPDGSVYWGNVVQKRQSSDDDGGYYSSYGLMNSRTKLYIIYNEDISSSTNLSSYAFDADGNYTVSSLMRVKDYNLMLAPRYARQISADELVIPAFNERNDFLLVKIDYSKNPRK
ncbi:MAG TPA: hypothetical protein PK239_10605 [Chitinophagales bacterium]|nr:hypothetical protein [Chitinophagales bacterium]